MRRTDREAGSEFALSIIDKCQFGIVSMVLPDGKAYGVPLSVARIGDVVYFHCAKVGLKMDALNLNPQVCVTCVGDVQARTNEFSTEYESAIVFGNAKPVTDEGERRTALKAICEKYCMPNMEMFETHMQDGKHNTAIFAVKIETITGKRKKYGDDGKEIKFR